MDALFESVSGASARGDWVVLRRFGVFRAAPRKSRPASVSGGSVPSSASRTPRWPEPSPVAGSIRPGAGSKPSRRDTSRRRRGLGATPDRQPKGLPKSGLQGCRSGVRRGVAPSPTLRPKGGELIRQDATETQQGQQVWRTVGAGVRARKTQEGGSVLFAAGSSPEGDPSEGELFVGVGRCRFSRICLKVRRFRCPLTRSVSRALQNQAQRTGLLSRREFVQVGSVGVGAVSAGAGANAAQL